LESEGSEDRAVAECARQPEIENETADGRLSDGRDV
jgi:hypothetical protein